LNVVENVVLTKFNIIEFTCRLYFIDVLFDEY